MLILFWRVRYPVPRQPVFIRLILKTSVVKQVRTVGTAID